MSNHPEPDPQETPASPDAVWLDLVARLESTPSIEVSSEPSVPSSGPRDYAATEEYGDFVPPEPESLRTADPALVLAWLGAVLGPLALLAAAIFIRQATLTVLVGIIAVFLVSVGYLIYRMPHERDEDNNDDGAVV